MKLFKTLATGAALLSIASMANADVIFHITGSTAFRAGCVTEIQNAINGSATIAPQAYDNSTYTSANNLLWTGSNGTLGNYTIKASFNGSGAGVQLVSGSLAIPFISNTESGLVAVPTVATTDDVSVPDAAMSDVFQATTGFLGNVPTYLPLGTNGGGSGTKQNHTYSALTDNEVAIVTFKPMASASFPQGTGTTFVDYTGTFNVSSYSMRNQVFNATWSNGSTLLSLYTGGTADEASVVWATGRNQDSGTRMTYLAEDGYGVNNPVTQYFPTVTSGTVTAVNEYSITTINGISTLDLGNGGESSGGTVRGYLAYPFESGTAGYAAALTNGTNGHGYFMTVLGTADSASVASAAIELPYDGTYFTDTGVQEGSYSLWSYEHEFLRPGLAGTGLTFANSLAHDIKTAATSNLANAGLAASLMQVSRPGDGGQIGSLNY